ncbi:MAG: hypothetical protein ACREPX_10625 [Rhodanobacteraceae bacterium]
MNTKMKVLSLALLGLVGYAGSAAAGCPGSPVPPWTTLTELGTGSAFAIVAGGLDSSACSATSTLGASVTAAATVTDETPANEPSYRFQFLIDPDALGPLAGATESVSVFRANAAAAANGRINMLTVFLQAGPAGAKRLRFVASCNTPPAFVCAQSFTTDLPAGVTRVEGRLTTPASTPAAQLDYWVNAAQGTSEPAASGTIAALDNGAWVGVKTAIMGMSGPTTPFAAAHGGQAVGFDTFDSRRATYIGW